MTKRILPVAIAATLTASLMVAFASPANASCAPPPSDALSFEEMIDQGTTGNDAYPVMFLGVVASWHDLGGRPGGGRALARLAVAEDPVGRAPLVSDVSFFRQYPGVGSSFDFEFKTDGRYVVVGRRMDDGTFKFDGVCGQTKRLNRERFRDLVRYARAS